MFLDGLDPSLQISDASPLDDGSVSTNIVDQSGTVVATVTRAPNGVATAAVNDSGGFDWDSILKKVTGFLDNVANAAKGASQEAQRISNAAKGATTGAKLGYEAPVDKTPYLIAGGAVLLIILASIGANKHNR